jgi:hypothetical protein
VEKILAATVPLALAAIFVAIIAFGVPACTQQVVEERKQETQQIKNCTDAGGSWLISNSSSNRGQCILGGESR